jgi:two-component system, OmpR family, sensor kinase
MSPGEPSTVLDSDRERNPLAQCSRFESRIAELEAEIRARDDFLAIAAHELRNPMTPIAAWAELLSSLARREAERVPPEILTGLARLEKLVDAYVRRATTFLDMSRISSKNLQLNFSEFNLSAVLEQAIAAISPAGTSAGSSITFDVQDNVIATLDRTAVEQIVENLLSNAVRYGAGEPVHISLFAGDATAELSIRDHGIGIAPADRHRIFEQFQRGATSKSDGGFGVGLWITRQLVLAMGGKISVASDLGVGSTFTVVLPLNPKSSHVDRTQ